MLRRWRRWHPGGWLGWRRRCARGGETMTRNIVAMAGALLALLMAAPADAGSLSVTVSGQQGAVAGATVCVGTAADRGFYGVRTTGQGGSASFGGLPDN